MIDESDFNSTEPLETIQGRRCGRIILKYRGTIPNVKRWSTDHSYKTNGACIGSLNTGPESLPKKLKNQNVKCKIEEVIAAAIPLF